METEEKKVFVFKMTIDGINYTFSISDCSTEQEAKEKLKVHLNLLLKEIN